MGSRGILTRVPRGRNGSAPRRASPPKVPSRRLGIRPSIEASASNIARLLLGNSRFWEVLNSGEHEILCALEGDFGDLFRWIDAQSGRCYVHL